jgi:phytoene synthase
VTAVEEAHQSLARHGRTFALASRFLPRDRRDDAAVLYALCRHIDDLADEAPDPATAKAQLDAFIDELDGRAPASPIVTAWADVAARRQIPRDPLDALIAGVRSDLEEVRVADDAQLITYCYRVAGAVGLLMCGVLGVRDAASWPLAVDLGVGMQLTNICRDVREDAQRGRVYLPSDRLLAAGTSADAVARGEAPARAVSAVVTDLLRQADERYARGELGLVYLPWQCRFAIRAAARLYRAIGVRLRRLGADPLRGRTVVPWHGKAFGLVDAAFRPLPLAAAGGH